MSDQSNIEVKFAVYKDKTRTEFKVKKEFKGSILKIIDLLLDYTHLFNDISAKIIDDKPQGLEFASYPNPSLREIIMNSIAMLIFQLIQTLKLIFLKTGWKCHRRDLYMGGLTIEDILEGRQISRNPGLVNILTKLRLIENYGTGIERTIKAYEPYKASPEFGASNVFFTVKLPNINYFLDAHDLRQNITTQNTT